MKKLSWKARHVGDRYCSPACGANCSRAAYESAAQKAAALVARLGSRFKPRVWENLGWHYGAVSTCDRLYIRERDTRSYSCFLNDKTPSGRWVGEGTTPQAAIADARRKALEEQTWIAAVLDGLPTGHEKKEKQP